MKKYFFIAIFILASCFNAQEKFSNLKRVERKGFYLEEDKFRQLEFLTPNTVSNNQRYFYLSQNKEGKINLFYKLIFSGKNWIFFEKVIFLIDGKIYEISNFKTNNTVYLGGVSEVAHIYCNEKTIDVLRKIPNSNEVLMRLQGDNGVKDFKFSKGNKKDVKKILTLYDKLKN